MPQNELQHQNKQFVSYLQRLALALDLPTQSSINQDIKILVTELNTLETEELAWPTKSDLERIDQLKPTNTNIQDESCLTDQLKPTNTNIQDESCLTDQIKYYGSKAAVPVMVLSALYAGYQYQDKIGNIIQWSIEGIKHWNSYQDTQQKIKNLNDKIIKLEEEVSILSNHQLQWSIEGGIKHWQNTAQKKRLLTSLKDNLNREKKLISDAKFASAVKFASAARFASAVKFASAARFASAASRFASAARFASPFALPAGVTVSSAALAFLSVAGARWVGSYVYQNYYTNNKPLTVNPNLRYNLSINPRHYGLHIEYALQKKTISLLEGFKDKISNSNSQEHIKAIKQAIDMYLDIYLKRRLDEMKIEKFISLSPFAKSLSTNTLKEALKQNSEASTQGVQGTMKNTAHLLLGSVYMNRVNKLSNSQIIKDTNLDQEINTNLENLKQAHNTLVHEVHIVDNETANSVVETNKIETNIKQANNNAEATRANIKYDLQTIKDNKNTITEVKDLIDNYTNNSAVIDGLDEFIKKHLLEKITKYALKSVFQSVLKLEQDKDAIKLVKEINNVLNTKHFFSSQSSRLKKLGKEYLKNNKKKYGAFCIELANQEYITQGPITTYIINPIKTLAWAVSLPIVVPIRFTISICSSNKTKKNDLTTISYLQQQKTGICRSRKNSTIPTTEKNKARIDTTKANNRTTYAERYFQNNKTNDSIKQKALFLAKEQIKNKKTGEEIKKDNTYEIGA